jgi:hypothetical protein
MCFLRITQAGDRQILREIPFRRHYTVAVCKGVAMRPQELKPHEPFDFGSIIVIIITLILFVIALFAKGLTHELLLEGAVFLVSVKLIVNGYKNTRAFNALNAKLNDIHEVVHNNAEFLEFMKQKGK